MSDDDIRTHIADIGSRRARAAETLAELVAEEEAAIVTGWRQGVPPGEIAQLAKRSPAHVRNLRPDDVPPARTGGMYAIKKRQAENG